MRTVPEWIGASDDATPTGAAKARILLQHGSRCASCGIKFFGGDSVEFDHIKPLCLGGENRESNLQPLHRACHKVKTKQDVASHAKARRLHQKHLGIARKGKPIPGSKASGWKKKLNGEVERRI